MKHMSVYMTVRHFMYLHRAKRHIAALSHLRWLIMAEVPHSAG